MIQRPLPVFVVLIIALCLASASLLAQDKAYRRTDDPWAALKLTAKQEKQEKALGEKYGSKLQSLQKKQDQPDFDEKLALLNFEYTKARLKIMAPAQRQTFVKIVRALKKDFLAQHPEAKESDIFMWGCAVK